MNIRKLLRTLTLLCALTWLSGCAVAPTNLADGTSIPKDSGVLIVGLHTDWEGHNNPLLANLELLYIGNDDPSLAFRKLVFKGANHYAVIVLPAKKYHFYQESFGNRYAEIAKTSEFEIKPNAITYIGDITSNISISGFSAASTLRVNDKLNDALAYLNSNYPKLAAAYPVEKWLMPLTVGE